MGCARGENLRTALQTTTAGWLENQRHMSSNSELNSLSFLFRHTRLDPLEEIEREQEIGDMKHDVEKDDLKNLVELKPKKERQ